jgi:hypothetical protein
MNPELRQTLQSISRNLESANEAAQENIYTFTQLYIDPCLTGFKACINDFTSPCFPGREEKLRRKRGRSRGRAELNFDFYDDWEDDDDPGQSLLGWGNDDLDRVLAGSQTLQPERQRPMSYGSRNRRKSIPSDVEADPTVIPGSSYLGFLERLPWKIGQKNLRYKPSAADLQENPGRVGKNEGEVDPLIEASDEDDGLGGKAKHGRKRSGTAASRSTTNSLSSRGDLIPSDEEADAVPLDDEFAMMLARRTTNTGSEDQSIGRASSKMPEVSRASTRTVSSKSTNSRRSSSKKSVEPVEPSVVEQVEAPTIVDLNKEEEQARVEQEMEVDQKRRAAQKLAADRGLESPGSKVHVTSTLLVSKLMRVLQTPSSDPKSEATSEDRPIVAEDSPKDKTKQEEPPTKPPDIFEEPTQIPNATTL